MQFKMLFLEHIINLQIFFLHNCAHSKNTFFVANKKVEKDFQILKSGVKNDTLTINEIDKMSFELLGVLGTLTQNNVVKINEKETINTYKERVWMIIENVGLLAD